MIDAGDELHQEVDRRRNWEVDIGGRCYRRGAAPR